MPKVLLGQLLQLSGCVALAVAIFYSAPWVRGVVIAAVVSFLIGRYLTERPR